MAKIRTVSIRVTADEKWPDLFVEETELPGSVRIPAHLLRSLRRAQRQLEEAQREILQAALDAGLSMHDDDIAAFLEEA